MAESRQRSRLPRNLLIGFLVLFVLYTLAGFLLLPWWLEKSLPEQLDQRMGWQAAVTDIRANPFALSVDAMGLEAVDSDGEPVVAFERLRLNLNFFQLVRGIVGFEEIQLDEPFIRVDLLEDYGINFARDWQNANPGDGTEPPVENDDASDPLPLYFGQIVVNGGELLFRDFSQQEMAEFRIEPLDLTLNDFATWPREDQGSDYSLMAALGSQTIEWEGDLSVAPFYSRGSLIVSSVGYETLSHFLAPYLPYDLRGGSVTLSSDYVIQAGDAFYLETTNGELALEDLAIALDEGSEQARLTNGKLAVDAIRFDLTGREISVGQVSLENLDLALARDENGQIDWLAPLAPAGGDSDTGDGEAAAAGSEAPFRWSLAGITLTGSRVLWQDRQPESAAEIALEQLSLSTGTLSHELEEPVSYRMQGALASGGRLSLAGQVTPSPFTLEAAISGTDVALAAFQPYVAQAANIEIASGLLGLDGNLDLDGQKEPLTGTFSGTGEVTGLNMRLPEASDELVSWQSLRLAPIEYNVYPARLEIGTVTLTEPSVNVVRESDGLHNLERIIRASDNDDSEAPGDDASGEPDFIFRIEQFLLERGEVSYTDRSLEPAFTTTLQALNGSVSGIANVSPQQGDISLRGLVNGSSELTFDGSLGTLGTDDVSTLTMGMKGASLPNLSPYFGRYLGYGVDSGKLDLDVNYEIAGSRIQASNLIIMDRLELGQPVVSDQATSAPVKLGLALLRDRKGMIEIDLPVSGDLQDPDFSVGNVVMRAFVNILSKAAASPFSVLGSVAELAGLSGDQLSEVRFVAGTAELAEGERVKLDALADALTERPALLLNIRGGVAPEADGLALLRQRLTRQQGGTLSETDWAEAREAFLAGERSLPPEALGNLAAERGAWLKKELLESYDVAADQLFLLDPQRDARADEQGLVAVQFALDAR